MILDRIVASTTDLIAVRKSERPLAELVHRAADKPPTIDFKGALTKPGIGAIAEIKRASPSKGPLCEDIDASRLATIYERNGAAAISVLTEPAYFRGSPADLEAARSVVNLPVLRKDFLVDPYQVYEARVIGADAFLLIVALLSHGQLVEFAGLGRELGMIALVEVHDEAEVDRALAAGAEVIGVNNRNLADFTVDLGTSARLRRLIPRSIPVVGESGIHSAADVEQLALAGMDAILVGEALVTSVDPGKMLRSLLGH